MTTDKSARLAEIAERHARATKGNWSASGVVRSSGIMRYFAVLFGDEGRTMFEIPALKSDAEYLQARADQHFIAHAHQDIPYLLAELTASQEMLKMCAGLMREAAGVVHDHAISGHSGDWRCDRCSAESEVRGWPHFDQFTHGPDCLVTELCDAAEKAEHHD